MTPIDTLQLQINTWADSVFPNRTDASILLKLYSELGEMIDNPGDPLEHADVFILLLDFAARHKIDVESAIKKKLAINKERDWKVDLHTGMMSHVK